MSATYLNRPVLDLQADVSQPPRTSFVYDQKRLAIGFGDRGSAATALHVAHTWDIDLHLDSPKAIRDADAFFERLVGNLRGFWAPDPMEAFRIISAPAGNQIDILDQHLTEAWGDSPAVHLHFEHPTLPPRMAAITGVADLGGGIERVTLDTTFDPALDAEWMGRRFRYVRLAGRTERGTIVAEHRQRRRLTVAELPHEYVTAETGELPVWLYHFWIDAGGTLRHWYFTSHLDDVVSNSTTYTAARIDHGRLTRSLRTARQQTTIEIEYSDASPVSLLFPLRLSSLLHVEILLCDLTDPDTTSLEFSGRVRRGPLKGKRQSAEARDRFAGMVPVATFGYGCANQFNDPETCKLDPIENTGTITVINGREVTLTDASLAGLGANVFAQGWLRTGTGAAYEVRGIESSAAASGNNVLLRLTAALSFAATSQAATARHGCNGNFSRCLELGNTENFHACPSIPTRNLTMKAFNVPTQTGKK